MDGTQATATAATTTFHTDANVVTVGVTRPQYTPQLLVDASSDLYTQEIKTFLSKPVIAQQGSFSTTDTVSTFAAVQAHVPFRSTLYADKLSGYYGIRYDLVVKLVVNATRFQAGRYMVLFNPYGGADPTQRLAVIKNSRIFKLTQRTTMPHAEIDVSCDTELEFRIPFSNAFSYSPTNLFTSAAFNLGSIGEIQIFPYSALSAVAGSLSCSYTMYFSMENVSLYGAAVPQSSNFSSRRKGTQAEEQRRANMGPISSSLATVSQSFSILSQVPLISSYARTTAWFADRMSKTAEIFGFSKPVNLEHPRRVTNNLMNYVGSVDGPDQSIPLALSYKNETCIMSGGSPTDLDEMDLNYIASIPAYVETVPWNAIQTAGTLLKALPVTPLYGSVGFNTNGITINTDPPCSFVSRYFKYWRGSVVYKFKIVRTEFHSGRLAFSFNPVFQDPSGLVTPSYTDTNYVHREIVDIREHTEMTFTIPYVSPTPYTLCVPTIANNGIGTFTIHVVDALVAPSTVSANISILVEICAGPDMEWAVPSGIIMNTVTNVVPQSGTFRQGNDSESMCRILTKTVGSTTVKDDGNLSSLLCMGEKVSSFRAMLKKPHILTYSSAIPAADLYTSVAPYFISMTNLTGATVTRSSVNADLYSYLGSCYLYSRGGIRIKFIDMTNPVSASFGITTLYTGNLTSGVTSMINFGPITWNGALAPAYMSGMIPSNVSQFSQGTEIQVPPYFNLPLRINSDCMSNPDHPYRGENGTTTRNFAPDVYVSRVLSAFNVTSSPRVLRSVADDGNFSFFLCAMPYTNVGAAN